MDLISQMLQVSANLYKYLIEIPTGDKRTEYIDKINNMLNERGQLVELLKQDGFQFDPTNKTHAILLELDKGIRERLDNVMNQVKTDMKNLINSKKHEMQYINPYSNVRVMDGRYYDKKK